MKYPLEYFPISDDGEETHPYNEFGVPVVRVWDDEENPRNYAEVVPEFELTAEGLQVKQYTIYAPSVVAHFGSWDRSPRPRAFIRRRRAWRDAIVLAGKMAKGNQ